MTDRPATANHARMMQLVEQLGPETRARLAGRLDDRFHEITGTPRVPARIQRRRIKGWRAPEGAVYVGRGTKWGNPHTQVRYPALDGSEWEHEGRLGKTSGHQHAFVHPDKTVTWHLVKDATREQATELYRRWLTQRPELATAARELLAGRDLMCWCPLPEPGAPDHCHAAVLLALANPTP